SRTRRSRASTLFPYTTLFRSEGAQATQTHQRILVGESWHRCAQRVRPERRVQSLCRAATHDGRQLRLRQQLDQILLRRRLALIGCVDDTRVGGLAPAALGKPVRDLLRRPVGTPV